MTFTELQTRIAERLGIPATATESYARIGRAINDVYREVTSSLNIPLPRRSVAVVGTTTQGYATVTFSGIEKIERVILDTSGTPVVLDEVSFDQLRQENPAASDNVTAYAIESSTGTSVTIRMNVVAQTAFDLKVDGRATVTDLSGVLVPAFAVSFHDVLIHGVMVSEYRKSEKVALMRAAQIDYERRLSQLRLDIAQSTSLSIRQGMNDGSTAAASVSGGGSATSGGESYIQTGLMTFDRDPLAPFAVTSGSAMVANLDAEKVGGSTLATILSTALAAATAALPNVTLAGAGNYLSLAGQVLTRSLIDLAAHVTGRLPFANLTAATAASRLLGRRSGSAGDLEEVSLSGNLSMSVGAALDVNTTTVPLKTDKLSVFAATTSAELAGVLSDETGSGGGFVRATSPTIATPSIDVITLTGGQIVFPASQSASAGANTLDDYEEGTWTPVIGGSGGTSGQTYGTQGGTYVKIGKLVICQFQATLTAKGTITTNVQIQGLPFTVTTPAGGQNAIGWDATATSYASVFALPIAATTTANLRAAAGSAVTANSTLATADIANTTTFFGTIIYFAA